LTIWTIGHSTRPMQTFLDLLSQYGLQGIADVRRFPDSRRHPQFSSVTLPATLARHGIAYHWFAALGGRRRPRPDSPNIAWRNASFRGYADYMSSAEFARGLSELLDFGVRQRTALMCAEAVWWRCHRALIADLLSSRGIEVIHVLDGRHAVVHPYTSAARIVRGELSYQLPAGRRQASGSGDR
jgi:uncharacterized protein (DUF488 family)